MPPNSTDDQREAGGAKSLIAVVCVGASVLLFAGLAAAFEQTDRSLYAAAAAYCRSRAGELVLNEEKSIYCFDGDITRERDVSSLELLNRGGLFVVRSPGGNVAAAARIATLLEEKKVTLVIYDYCISACAQYFVVAGARAYVLKDTIVAWHYGWREWPPCDEIGYGVEYRYSDGARRLRNGFCYELPQQEHEAFAAFKSIATQFFKRRIINPARFNLDTPPQSDDVVRVLRSRIEATGTYRKIAWMWNPRHYKPILRTEVIYEKYPESQDEVDALTRRYFNDRATKSILHDP